VFAKNDTILAFNSVDGNQAVLFRWMGEHEKMIDIGNKFDQSGAEAVFACSIAELSGNHGSCLRWVLHMFVLVPREYEIHVRSVRAIICLCLEFFYVFYFFYVWKNPIRITPLPNNGVFYGIYRVF